METISIKVYSGFNLGECRCGCTALTPAQIKIEYQNVKQELLKKYGEHSITFDFIDTGGVNLSACPEVEKVIRAGYSFPVTVINGSPCLAGVISAYSIIAFIGEHNK